MDRKTYRDSEKSVRESKHVFRSIARSTDTRTLIGSLIAPLPTGHSLAVLLSNRSTLLAGLMSTFTLDWAIRQRMAGTNLSWFVLQDLPTPPVSGQAKLFSLASSQIGRAHV